ncbi:MAG: LamG domain-containing protein [Candidatus Poribacteria bacterium]|nr:LamG domain-containing protein [Candidatus Poribacteria bacterium]
MKRMMQINAVVLIGSLAAFTAALAELEGAWLFDSVEDGLVEDISGKGRDALLGDGATIAGSGPFGSLMALDGSATAGATITGYKGVGGGDARTIIFWWKGDAVIEHSWVKWGQNATGTKYYIRAHRTAPECYLRIETSGGQHYGTTNVCDGEWHHLAVVYPEGGNGVKDHLLYVDGVEEAETAGNPVAVDTDNAVQDVAIGHKLLHHVNANGSMDEVAIYSSELSAGEINDIMDGGLRGFLSVNPEGKAAAVWGRLKAETR